MKKVVAFLLSFVLFITCFNINFSANANTELVEGIYTYKIEDQKATILYLDETANGVISVPETLGGCPVTKIDGGAFFYLEEITEITLPQTITEIGECAFAYCRNLKSINIPSGILEIKYQTFYYCDSLEEIALPNKIESIGTEAFARCYNLKNLEIPNSVTTIGEQAFFYCESIKELKIGSSLCEIKTDAFKNCHDIESINVSEQNENFASYNGVLFNKQKSALIMYPKGNLQEEYTLPLGVTEIKEGAFDRSYKLKSVILNEGLIKIGEFAFSTCTQLKSVSFSSSVTDILEGAFFDCGNLNSLALNEGLKVIKDDAFAYCEELTVLNLPSSLEEIGAYAFSDNLKLETVKIGKGLKTIGYRAFNGCKRLKGFEVSLDNQCFYDDGGVLYTKDKTTLLVYPVAKKSSSYTCIYGTKTIKEEAFKHANILTNVYLPGSLQIIENSAFYECAKLKSIVIPYGVKAIEKNTFSRNINLLKVTIPSSVKIIKEYAFTGCEKIKSTVYLGTKQNWEQTVEIEDSNRMIYKYMSYIPATVKLKNDSYTYNGKVKTPSLIVKTAAGTKVTSKHYNKKLVTNGKDVNEHKIKVTFKSKNYSGIKYLYFTIKPRSTGIKKLNAYKKSIKVYINKQAIKTSGYQVEWSNNSGFKNSNKALIKSNGITSYTIKNLKRNTKYYLRVRTYKTVNGKRIYSSYSSCKYTKTK